MSQCVYVCITFPDITMWKTSQWTVIVSAVFHRRGEPVKRVAACALFSHGSLSSGQTLSQAALQNDGWIWATGERHCSSCMLCLIKHFLNQSMPLSSSIFDILPTFKCAVDIYSNFYIISYEYYEEWVLQNSRLTHFKTEALFSKKKYLNCKIWVICMPPNSVYIDVFLI